MAEEVTTAVSQEDIGNDSAEKLDPFNLKDPSQAREFGKNLPPPSALALGGGPKDLSTISSTPTKPLEYFRELQNLPPSDKLKVVLGTDLNTLIEWIDYSSRIDQTGPSIPKVEAEIAEAAHQALGDKNIKALARVLTESKSPGQLIEEAYKYRVALILARTLPLKDASDIFIQAAALSKRDPDSTTKFIDFSNPERMIILFRLGMRSLAQCIKRNIDEHPQTMQLALQTQAQAAKNPKKFGLLRSGKVSFSPEVQERAGIIDRGITNGLEFFFRLQWSQTHNIEAFDGYDLEIINYVRSHMFGGGGNTLDNIMGTAGYKIDRTTHNYIKPASLPSAE